MNEREMLEWIKSERNRAHIREDVQGNGTPVMFWIGFREALRRMEMQIIDARVWEKIEK